MEDTHTGQIYPHIPHKPTYCIQHIHATANMGVLFRSAMSEGTRLFPGQGSVSATRWKQCEERGGVASLGLSVTVRALRMTASQLRSQRLGVGRPVILEALFVMRVSLFLLEAVSMVKKEGEQ